MTKKTIMTLIVLATVLGPAAQGLCDPAGLGKPGQNPATMKVDGIMGLHPAQENSCFAIWIPVAGDQALKGIEWYNNDGSVIFPEVLVQSGSEGYPVQISGAQTVARDVSGASEAWSKVEFEQAVASSRKGFYVLITVPEDSRNTAQGFGGGPGLGYTTGKEGFTGWLSSDGQDWVRVKEGYGFAVRPIFVDREEGMLEKSADGAGSGQNLQILETRLNPAYPNPFNPRTSLSFSLKDAAQVDLSIYNLKGEKVATLASGQYPRGTHDFTWAGKNTRGRQVASGVYFARLKAGQLTMSQRLVLIQ